MPPWNRTSPWMGRGPTPTPVEQLARQRRCRYRRAGAASLRPGDALAAVFEAAAEELQPAFHDHPLDRELVE